MVSEFAAFRMLERSLRWLRGMSIKQILGCNNLLHALRDDLEQGSTYRVRDCLTLLGLRPLLTDKQIAVTMSLSQGSDLAFLWFIWEAFYKTSRDLIDERTAYSTNEQLILSAIAHLDMKTTLRALDQILPTAEHSTKYQEMQRAKARREARRKRQKSEQRCKPPPFVVNKDMTLVERDKMLKEARKRCNKRVQIASSASDDKTSPYLLPQLRPKPYAPMTLQATPKERQVIFPRYDAYQDKLYQIPNESRWFASYELSPVKRIVKHCLSDALAPLFGGSRQPLERSVCNVHRMLEFAAARKQQELTVETTERCLSLLRGKKDAWRRHHIVCQLERDVRMATEQLRRQARQQLVQLQRLIGGPCSVGVGCPMCGKLGDRLNFEGRPQRTPDFSFLLDDDFIVRSPPLNLTEQDEPVRVIQLGAEKLLRLITPDTVKSLRNTLGSNAHCGQGLRYKGKAPCPPVEGLIKVLDSKGKLKKVVMPAIDTVNCCLAGAGDSSDDTVNKFCSRRNMKNGLLEWDYFKVFKPAEGEQLDASTIIRSYCIKALKEAMKATKTSIKSAIDKRQHCGYKTTKDDDETSSRLSGGLETSATICHKTPADRFKQLQSIDPDDVNMLIKLLKIAIDIMRKDPQYVLVTLPNAHMMPVLIDWVAARYGKTYNHKEMDNMAKSMEVIKHALKVDIVNQNPPFPNRNSLAQYKNIESYDKHKVFNCNVGKLRSEYHSTLNKAAMDEARLIWLAMHGYSNLAGSVTDTYFAYLPAKEADFMRHRLWNSTNYRNMVFLRRRKLK